MEIKTKRKLFIRKIQKEDWKYFKKWWTDKYLISLTGGEMHRYFLFKNFILNYFKVKLKEIVYFQPIFGDFMLKTV